MGILGLTKNNNETQNYIMDEAAAKSFYSYTEWESNLTNSTETSTPKLQYSIDCFLHGVD
jgi:hypothetical protein